MKPIQILAVLFAALVIIVSVFLMAAIQIKIPVWITPLLSISSVLLVPTFLFVAYILITKYRHLLQDDPFYNKYLLGSPDEATRQVEAIKIGDEEEIKYSKKRPFRLDKKDTSYNFLFFKARIYYPIEAGAQYLMRIKVNNIFLNSPQLLINKPLIKKNIDGREFSWYYPEKKSWMLCFSPNFKDNYINKFYKVDNGDPYTFLFDLTNIPSKDNKYIVEIEHNGGITTNEAHKNSIIIRDIQIM